MSRRRGHPPPLLRSLTRSALLLVVCAVVSGCVTYADRLKKGDDFLSLERWQEAEAAYNEAHASDPSRPDAKLRLAKLSRAWAESLVKRAEGQRASGDLEGATATLQEALKIDPELDSAPLALRAVLDQRVAEADKLIADGKPGAALAAADSILKVEPRHPGARALSDRARTAIAQAYFAAAEDLERRGRLGLAMIEFAQAEQSKIGATPAGARLDAIRKRLMDIVTFVVATKGLEDRSASTDMADRLGPGRLGAALPDKLPIRILTGEPPIGAYGVKLTYSLDRVAFNRTKQIIQRVQNYRSGTKAVPNPNRAKIEKQVEDADSAVRLAEREIFERLRLQQVAQEDIEVAFLSLERCYQETVGRCQANVERCQEIQTSKDQAVAPCPLDPGCSQKECQGAQSFVKDKQKARDDAREKVRIAREALDDRKHGVEKAKLVLAREPITVDRPTYADFPYDAEQHKATVRASMTLRIDELANPLPGSPITLDFLTSHEDITNKGYDKYEVRDDPLELKSEGELRREAADKAAIELAKRVLAKFEAYRGTMTEDARRALARGGPTEDVIETSVRAILLSPDRPPQDLMTAVAKARRLQNPNLIFGR